MKVQTWHIHQDRDEDDETLDSYSITLNPEIGGWNTDSGYNGYGLPKQLAQWICDKLNAIEEGSPYNMQCGSWEKEDK